MSKGKIKPGYEYVNVHMILDIKMDGRFTRKARLVADSHTTAPLSSIAYSSFVSRESVRIAFLLASLDDFNTFACNNAYFNAKLRKKLWTKAGTEFRNEKRMVMIIARAMYGLKSSGYALRGKLAEHLM